MRNFEIFNETENKIDKLDELEEFIDFVLKREKLDNVNFNVIFVDNKMIREMNLKYRMKDSVTDVISFALEDYNSVLIDDIRFLGDIYISIDKTKEQAIEYGHSYFRELSFLTLHGLLHLLGYDHIKIEDEKIMFNKQEEILNEYGI